MFVLNKILLKICDYWVQFTVTIYQAFSIVKHFILVFFNTQVRKLSFK